MILYPNGSDSTITVVYKTMQRGRYTVAWSTYARYTDHETSPTTYVLALFRQGVFHKALQFVDIADRDRKFDYLLKRRIHTCHDTEMVWP